MSIVFNQQPIHVFFFSVTCDFTINACFVIQIYGYETYVNIISANYDNSMGSLYHGDHKRTACTA